MIILAQILAPKSAILLLLKIIDGIKNIAGIKKLNKKRAV